MLHFKLDENCDPRWREPLEHAGHDVSTAADEGLQGAEDRAIGEVCRTENRCLITADLDFAQILDYPPAKYSGLIILRHTHPSLAGMQSLIRQIAVAVTSESPVGRLWIVEPGRVRIHQTESEGS